MSVFSRILIVVFALAASAFGARAQNPSVYVKDYQTSGGTVRVAFLSMMTPQPAGTVGVILLPGGYGQVNFDSMGRPWAVTDGNRKENLIQNFLVRNRALFAQQGLMVAVVDFFLINGQGQAQRLTQAHADMISSLIYQIRGESMYQVSRLWLVGTSNGTLSALNTASKYPLVTNFNPDQYPPGYDPNRGRPNGIVLTSTLNITTSSPDTCYSLTDISPQPSSTNINVPAHVVWDLADQCSCSCGAVSCPPQGKNLAQQVVTQISPTPPKFGPPPTTPVRSSKAFNSTLNAATDQCSANTPHGYYGIDNDVVTYIVSKVKPH